MKGIHLERTTNNYSKVKWSWLERITNNYSEVKLTGKNHQQLQCSEVDWKEHHQLQWSEVDWKEPTAITAKWSWLERDNSNYSTVKWSWQERANSNYSEVKLTGSSQQQLSEVDWKEPTATSVKWSWLEQANSNYSEVKLTGTIQQQLQCSEVDCGKNTNNQESEFDKLFINNKVKFACFPLDLVFFLPEKLQRNHFPALHAQPSLSKQI